VIERQRVDERAEVDALGALADRRHQDAWRGRHAERRRMVFGNLVAIEAEAVVKLDQLQTVLIEIAQRRARRVEMIENAER